MMEIDESTVYRDLQKHLDSMPVGFPATESGVEIRILKRLFTPQEAAIAANPKFSWSPSETIGQIHQRLEPTGISKDEMKDSLDTMASKGLIFRKKRERSTYYGNVQWVIGIYEFQVNKMTAELYSDIVDYNIEAFGRELFYSPLPQLRVIPVGKSLE